MKYCFAAYDLPRKKKKLNKISDAFLTCRIRHGSTLVPSVFHVDIVIALLQTVRHVATKYIGLVFNT